MSFSYGSFYGMTGILSLYTSPGSFDAVLTAGTLSRDTRYRLMNLYQELHSLKQVFENTNLADKISDDIPKLIVSTDVNHTRAKNYLQGLNNYLNCRTFAKKSDSGNSVEHGDAVQSVEKSSFFSSAEETLDFDSTASLDFDGVGSLDFDNADSLNFNDAESLDFSSSESLEFDALEQPDLNDGDFLDLDSIESTSDEMNLFTAYEQGLSSGDLNLEEFGKQYTEQNIDGYRTYSWTEALKELRKLKNDLTAELDNAQTDAAVDIKKDLALITSFVEQKKKLPCTITRCSLPPLLKQQITKVFGFSNIDNDTDILKLLNAIYLRAYEPVATDSGETIPLIDKYLSAIQQAINAEDNTRSARFSVPMSTIRLWETAEYGAIFRTISGILERSFEGSIDHKEELIQGLIRDCDDLLGVQSEDKSQDCIYSAKDIIKLLEAPSRECTDYLAVYNKSNSKLDKDIQTSFLEFLIDISYSFNYGKDRVAFIQRATSSDDNIKFLYALKTALQGALSDFMATIRENCADLLSSTDELLSINLSNTDKLALIDFFKKFTVFTGICGCTFDPLRTMIATMQQTDTAVAYVKPVVFTERTNAFKALAVMKRNLQSTLHRLRRINERS